MILCARTQSAAFYSRHLGQSPSVLNHIEPHCKDEVGSVPRSRVPFKGDLREGVSEVSNSSPDERDYRTNKPVVQMSADPTQSEWHFYCGNYVIGGQRTVRRAFFAPRPNPRGRQISPLPQASRQRSPRPPGKVNLLPFMKRRPLGPPAVSLPSR